MRHSHTAAPAKFEAELFTAKSTSGLYCCAIRRTFQLKFSRCCFLLEHSGYALNFPGSASGVVDVSRALSVSPSAPRITAQRGARCDPYNTCNCLQLKKLR